MVPIPTSTKEVVHHEELLDLGLVFKARTVVEACKHFF